MVQLNKSLLRNLYLDKKLSVSEISNKLKISQSGINYWLSKYGIPKRTISDAVYLRCNKLGDPFSFNPPMNEYKWLLLGLGLGLYWGEGNKRSKSSVRLGNVDPKLIRVFIKFLKEIFSIDMTKLRFGLQVFSDTTPSVARNFWIRELKIKNSQFYKVTVTPSHKPGTYKNKSKFGVLTVYFNNVKLQKSLSQVIENFPSL